MNGVKLRYVTGKKQMGKIWMLQGSISIGTHIPFYFLKKVAAYCNA